MPRPLLPPRGLFVPTAMIFDQTLPETVRFTWILLRCLAWGKSETPMLSMNQLVEIIGKKQSALYKHMAILRDRGVLLWRPAGCGTLIVSFPDSFQEDSGFFNDESQEVSVDNVPSTFVESPVFKLNQESKLKEEEFKNTQFQKNGMNSTNVETYSQSKHSTNGVSERNSKALVEDQCTAAYKSITNFTPNKPQRQQILERVTDLDLWRSTLDHWLSHGWNPRNVLGMLNLYSQGGPDSCQYCHPKKQDAGPPIVDYAAQRERDRIEARKIIEEARAKRLAKEKYSSQSPSDPAESSMKYSAADQTSQFEV